MHTTPCYATDMAKMSSSLAAESKKYAVRAKDLHRQVSVKGHRKGA
jgi:hypothetical protein